METTTVKLWPDMIEEAYAVMVRTLADAEPSSEMFEQHLKDTPQRVKKALPDMFSGYAVDPVKILRGFENHGDEYDEMVAICNIEFVSFCAHHVLPFVGKAHFAYIPDKTIVGLSKVPRLIHAYSRRLQVQERLCNQIVTAFTEHIKPKGCGIVMEALHTCMSVRGVRQNGAVTKTTALRGAFKEPSVKAEFLSYVTKAGE